LQYSFSYSTNSLSQYKKSYLLASRNDKYTEYMHTSFCKSLVEPYKTDLSVRLSTDCRIIVLQGQKIVEIPNRV